MAPPADLVRVRIDIDEAPVNFALGGAVAQHAHRFGERRVDQHRPVDQRHPFGIAAMAVLGHDPFDEGGAAVPGIAVLLRQSVDFGQLQRREGPGKAGRGPRGKDQLDRRGQRFAGLCRGGRAEPDREAMLALLDRRRAVQPQHLRVALEIGRGHEQIDRMPLWQQRRIGPAALHRPQRLAQQPREAEPAERRLEPARADQAAEFGPHLAAGFPGDAGRNHVTGSLEQPVNDRHRPELGDPRSRPRIGIEQDVDIGALQPQVGQRLKALPGMDRLGQEHPVDPARAGPGDDIGQDPQAQAEMLGDPLE